MKCAVCHSKMILKKGEIDLRVEGRLYLVQNVLYEECPRCGEKVLSPEVSQMLYEKVKNKEYTEQAINVAVLDGTYG